MGLLRTLLVCATLALAIGFAAAGQPAQGTEDPTLLTVKTEAAPDKLRIPEPNTMLFAGLGGLILLLFAIRRK